MKSNQHIFYYFKSWNLVGSVTYYWQISAELATCKKCCFNVRCLYWRRQKGKVKKRRGSHFCYVYFTQHFARDSTLSIEDKAWVTFLKCISNTINAMRGRGRAMFMLSTTYHTIHIKFYKLFFHNCDLSVSDRGPIFSVIVDIS